MQIVQMNGITKTFPGVTANDHIDFELEKGEIHALLGENGSGKTTLMKILYGMYRPDAGEMFVKGSKYSPRSPNDAIRIGIGMVHQTFMQFPVFSVVENVVVGLRSAREPFLDLGQAEKKILEISDKFNLKVDTKAKVWQLSAGEQQVVEILKTIYRGADILILDEPTSVLTPQQAETLFKNLRSMKEQGMTVVFISHKLPEVLAISDRVTVLRRGKVVANKETRKTSIPDLTRMMVGREVLFELEKGPLKAGDVVLDIENLTALGDRGTSALKGVSLQVHGGEIVGIAGVAGNGQTELVEVITGLRRAAGGKIRIGGQDMTNSTPCAILEKGVAHIPEDRLGRGVVRELSIQDNMIITEDLHSKAPNAFRWIFRPILPEKCKWFLDYGNVAKNADKLISDFEIATPSKDFLAGHLSGGNLQKLILARELSRKPILIIASQPTSGLDVGASEYVRKRVIEARNRGGAVLLVSGDLDEIISVSDKIAVMYNGRIVGIVPPDTDIQEIGILMTEGKPRV